MLNKCKFCGSMPHFVVNNYDTKEGCWRPKKIYHVECSQCNQSRGNEKSYEDASAKWNVANPFTDGAYFQTREDEAL